VTDGVGKADPGASALRQEKVAVSTLGRVLVPRTGAVLAAHPSRVEELARQREYFWLDLVDGDGSELDRFSGLLGLDRRTLAFARRYEERPTVIPHGQLALLVMYGAVDQRHLVEVHAVVSGRFVITLHREPCPFLAPLIDPESDASALRSDGVSLLHRIAEGMIESLQETVDGLDYEIDDIEDGIFNNPGDELLQHLFHLKREVIEMRRVVVPERDLFSRLASGLVPVPGLDSEAGLYFQLSFDHLIRLSDLLDSYRDLLSGALDVYLSTVSTRVGTVTKQLAVIATIFLPLSFITGFFGQNFGYLSKHVGGPMAFWGLGIGVELAAVVIVLVLFRRRKWL
jgi:magnesium transporter